MAFHLLPGGLRTRHVQALIMFLALGIAYTVRVSLSVGIVAMTDNSTHSSLKTLDWSTAEKGTLLGSFFWGYILTQIPSGLVCQRLGAARPLGWAMIVNGASNLLIPVVAVYCGLIPACLLRALEGFAQGCIYPGYSNLMSKWVVPQEMGRMSSLIFGGAQFGSVIMMISGGYLAASSYGWPTIFYLSGALGVIWGVVCLLYLADSPDKHKTISKEERAFIESQLNQAVLSSDKLSTPWSKIFTSVPFWSLLLVHIAQSWGFWTFLTLIPTYLSKVLHFDIKKNGFLSALPYTAKWILSFVISIAADYLIKKKVFSKSTSRKFWASVALYGGAVAQLLLAFLKTDSTGAILLLTIAVGLNAGMYSGVLLNHIDLSPNFAGTLMGLTNCAANVGSFLAPTIAGFIITDVEDQEGWSYVFLISAGLALTGQTIFNLFGTAQTQPWNNPSGDPQEVGKQQVGPNKQQVVLNGQEVTEEKQQQPEQTGLESEEERAQSTDEKDERGVFTNPAFEEAA